MEGTVRKVEPRRVLVEREGETVEAHLRGALKEGPRQSTHVVAVGDRVRLHLDAHGAAVEEVLPRRNRISRADPGDTRRELVLAANLDLILVTVCHGRPRINPRGLDRLLALGEWAGVPPVILVNKSDLRREATSLQCPGPLEPYLALGYPVVQVSAKTGEGMESLHDLAKGKLSLLLGPSGVGKSALLNRLVPEARLRTRPVSRATGKGVHTTTRVEWIDLPIGGAVLDSPGIRSIHPFGLTRRALARCYVEFRSVGSCRFPDCLHQSEPECAVRESLRRGSVSPARYESYLRFLATLSDA